MSNEKRNSILKGFTTAALLGGLGYKSYEPGSAGGAIDAIKDIASTEKSELRAAGEHFASNVDTLKKVAESARVSTLESFRDKFLSRIEEFIPNQGGSLGVTNNEARAFLAAMFDSIREEELTNSNSDNIDRLIRNMYDNIDKPGSLGDVDRQTLRSFFSDVFGRNELALERFGKNYQKYASNIELFATESRQANAFTSVAGQKHFNYLDNIDSYFRSNRNSSEGIIRQRFQRLKGKFGREGGANISLIAIDEGSATGARSLYGQVRLANRRVINIPLFLGQDAGGNTIMRATEGLSSRYAVPTNVVQAHRMMSPGDLNTMHFNSINSARAGGAIVDFNSYIFEDILGGLRPGKIGSLSQREINAITAFQRNFGLDAPRTMISNYNGLISDNLFNNLQASRRMQSANALVTGLERFGSREQRDVVKSLIKFLPSDFIGINAQQTMTSRYEDPYNPGQTRMFGSVGVDTSGSINPFAAIRKIGIKDRGLIPQTAREGQMFGRYEAIEGLQGLRKGATFGRGNLPIIANAQSGDLLGVSRSGAGGTVGMNLAGFFVRESVAVKHLGLAEGVSYFGGNVITSTSMPKTVVETGLSDTILMRDLINASKNADGGGILVGDVEAPTKGNYTRYTSDEFFKKYGNKEGLALLGQLDSDFSSIKRRGGMTGFSLSLKDFSQEAGRQRYHLVGQMNNVNRSGKIFSFLIKDTTKSIDERTIRSRLASLPGGAGLQNVADLYFGGMGGRIENTLLTSTAQFSKSPYNIATGAFGALRMAGIEQARLDQSINNLTGTGFLNRINTLHGLTGDKAYTSMEDVAEIQRRGAYLDAVLETTLREGSTLDKQTLGHILGGMHEHGKKFGYTSGKVEERARLIAQDLGFTSKEIQSLMGGLKSNIIFASAYATTGGVHAELGRNLAKIEPRFLNYTYASLRSNFGLSAKESMDYMSSMLVRQQGVESRSAGILGMHMSMMSLGGIRDIDLDKMVSSFGGLDTLSKEEAEELIRFGQGSEKELKEFLSQRSKGQMLDLGLLIQDDERLKLLKERLGGRSKIFLPGADTLENFKDFKIRNAGQAVKIEGEYSRYLTDLVSSISGMRDADSIKTFQDQLLGFDQSKRLLSTVVGSAVRQGLTGEMLGSGSYMGSGFKFGAGAESATVFSKDLSKQAMMREGFLDAFNKNKGYVLFLDAQAFLDGMTTYRQAAIKELQSQGHSKGEARKLAKALEGERMGDFFFGMYTDEKRGPTGLGMRNPNVFITHFLPGVNLMRYDFAEGSQDAMFKYFKETRGKYLDSAGHTEYRARYIRELRRKQALHLGMSDFEETKYQDFLAERKRLKGEIDVSTSRLYGEPILKDGKRQYEEIDYTDKKGVARTRRTTVRDIGTISDEMREGHRRIEEFHAQRVAAKELSGERKASVFGNEGAMQAHRAATSEALQRKEFLGRALATPIFSYEGAMTREGSIYRKALTTRMDRSISTALRNDAASLADAKKVKLEVEGRLAEVKERLKVAKAKPEENAKVIRALEEEKIALRKSRSYLRDTINAKEKIADDAGEVGKARRRNLAMITSDGKIKFKSVTVRAGEELRSIKTSQILASNFKLEADGSVSRTNFHIDTSRLDYGQAFDDLLRERGMDLESTPINHLRKERELDVVRKRAQIVYEESNLNRLRSELSAAEKQKGKVAGRDANALDSQISELKKKIKASEIKLEGDSGLRRSIERLANVEGIDDIQINKVIASEAIVGHYEKISSSRGALQDDFMREVKGFYGIGPSGEESLDSYLISRRAQAKQGVMDFLQTNVGEGKRFGTLFEATQHLFDMPVAEFREFSYQKRKADGTFETVTKRLVMSEAEQRNLESLYEGYDEARQARSELFDEDALKKVEENNAVVQEKAKQAKLKQELEALERRNSAYLKLQELGIQQSQLSPEERLISLTREERGALKEGLEEHQRIWEELDPEAKARVQEPYTRLSRLEKQLGVKDISSFEELFHAAKGKWNDPYERMRYSESEGRRVLVQDGTIGDEINRMLMGVLDHHKQYGEYGGGLVHFAELNIEADLFNAKNERVTAPYKGRFDLSRVLIGDFDADIYQIYHDTNKILKSKFQQQNAGFHGFYQSGGEYLFNMQLLGQGMEQFSKRLGVSGMKLSETVLDEYAKERILKDVGPIDVQVKSGMLAMIQSAFEASEKGVGGEEVFRKIRAGASLVAVAQEVLVIKSKKLGLAAGVADEFLGSMKDAFKTGKADRLFNFFQENIFKSTIMEHGGEIRAKNIRFVDIPEGPATAEIRKALESVKINMADFRSALDEMAKVGHERGILNLGSDRRVQEIYKNSQLSSLRQFHELLKIGMEGGFYGVDGEIDHGALGRGFRNVEKELMNNFRMSMRGKGMAGLVTAGLAGSYLLGAGSSIGSLKPEEKFSDMRAKESIGNARIGNINRDHSNMDAKGIKNMGGDSGMHTRPINIGSSYITKSHSAKMYGEAPSYSDAMFAARRFSSVGGQAFVAVQDNRMPISNNYISKSIRD